MRFKPGDIVMKITGGNKMTIYDKVSVDHYKCIWFVESKLNESIFKEEELLTIPEWKRVLKIEEREDKINQLLG